MTPFEETIARQREAADPRRSAFVKANAGAGKTRVLTNRVARLLIAGADPAKILCITFTKAAAAEMADRLFAMLGDWSLMADAPLAATLDDLEGARGERGPEALSAVRRLFARALETPGGLKIQTIHSFCEGVLKRFPLEAGAPPGFTVLEDRDAAALIDAAIDALAVDALDNAALSRDLERLAAFGLEETVRALLRQAAAGAVAPPTDDHDEDEPRRRFVASLDRDRLRATLEALNAAGKRARKLNAAPIAEFLGADALEAQWLALSGLFLKSDGEPRGNYGDKAAAAAAPALIERLKDNERDFVAARAEFLTRKIAADTGALSRLAARVRARYEAAKAARAALDFDDLIERTRALFNATENAWIMYKLDAGVRHILVDEAQDTNPGQWDVAEALFTDYLAGAAETARSFFAVGDVKQSIYSFQGADAELFEEKETALGKALAAVGEFKSLDLELSFRTTAPVLDFVDKLFLEPGAAEGLGRSGALRHRAHREGEAGRVEIWPLTPRPETPKASAWDAPVDQPSPDEPAQRLAARVAETVAGWIRTGEKLESEDRPIRAGDVMILVQTRAGLFDAAIRCLAEAGVPVAGADRLKLKDDPAVEDLLAYARAILLSTDDLSLAETLKSPFFGLDDDDDLFPLAYQRKGSLWRALAGRRDERNLWARASDEIAAARRVARHEGAFAFFAHLLDSGAPSGRRRLYERLSTASREAIDELLRQALDFERDNPRSLRAFLSWVEAETFEIKREMDRADDAVRVMTVHAAKGLEANIVFLLDAHRRPKPAAGPLLADQPEAAGERGRGGLFLAGADAKSPPRAEAALTAARTASYEEYRRLLYVAATRARDRLYICGVESGSDRKPREKEAGVKSWHALAEDAMDRLGAAAGDEPFWPETHAPARRIVCPQTKPPREAEIETRAPSPAPPEWLWTPAPRERAPTRLAPSRLLGEDEDREPVEPGAYSPLGPDRYLRGRALHRLLELLPEVAVDERGDAAARLLARIAPTIDAATRDEWRAEALAVLNDAAFAPVFAPGSRAEVAVAGRPKAARADLIVSGQIDRLAVGETRVLIVDYKTNRPPPDRAEATSPGYLAQMAAYRALLQDIYPGREIACALLWTYAPKLMALPGPLLDHAFARYASPG